MESDRAMLLAYLSFILFIIFKAVRRKNNQVIRFSFKFLVSECNLTESLAYPSSTTAPCFGTSKVGPPEFCEK